MEPERLEGRERAMRDGYRGKEEGEIITKICREKGVRGMGEKKKMIGGKQEKGMERD